MRKPLLTAVLATQLIFSLACGAASGVSEQGNEAGQDVRLDDTPAPTEPERTDLANDDRCDWLGTPFASLASEQAYVLRSTDPHHDCNGSNQAAQKLLFRLGSTPLPILDVSDLTDVRILEAAAGLVVFSEGVDGGEHTWLIDPATGAILEETELPLRITRLATSPSRNWVAVGEDFRTLDHLLIQLLDPTTLELTPLTFEGYQGAYAWAEDDLLATAEVTDHGMRLALWDLQQGVPDAPVFESWIEGAQVDVLDPLQMVVSADGRFIAVEVDDGTDGIAILDREDGSIQRHVGFEGGLAFTAEGLLVGGAGNLVQVADPVLRQAHTVQLDFAAVVVLSETGSDALIVPRTPVVCDPEEEEAGSTGGGLFDDLFADLTGDCVPADEVVDPGLFRLNLVTGEQTWLGQGSGLTSYTRRDGAIWLAAHGTVARIELDEAVLTEVPGAGVRRVLWLPGADRIYTDRSDAPVVQLLDPELLTVTKTYELTGDFAALSALRAL